MTEHIGKAPVCWTTDLKSGPNNKFDGHEVVILGGAPSLPISAYISAHYPVARRKILRYYLIWIAKSDRKMSDETIKKDAPPYVSYGTFRNFITGLKKGGHIPNRIDKSILSTMSGSGQAALTSALKFLGLTDEVGIPTQQLRNLVSADEDGYSVLLKEILNEKYAFVTAEHFRLSTATGAEVESKFKECGITGSTVSKSVAFFIAACKATGIEISAHVKAPKVPRSNGNVRTRKKAGVNSEDQPPQTPPPPALPPQDITSLLLNKFPNFDPAWPDDLKTKWFESFQKLQGVLDEGKKS